jgi:hypothetical protein
MGLDLTIFPLEDSEALLGTSVSCRDRLTFDRDPAFFDQLIKTKRGNTPTILAKPIPAQLWVKFTVEEGVRRTREDVYGQELTFVYAQQLKKLIVPNDASPKNRAIKAFLDALPNDIPIILLWG